MAKRHYDELTTLDRRLNAEMAEIARRALALALIDGKTVTWTTDPAPWALESKADETGRFTGEVHSIEQVGVCIRFFIPAINRPWSVLGEDFAEFLIDGAPLKVELE